ncbi:MAG: hypothetical protein AAGB29_06785 [Planctomycetota bacterium]
MALVGAFILLVVAVTGLSFLVAMIAAAYRAMQSAEQRRHAEGDDSKMICLRCGYPGRGLEGKPCPECGGTFVEVAGGGRSRRREALSVIKGVVVAVLGVGLVTALMLLMRLTP